MSITFSIDHRSQMAAAAYVPVYNSPEYGGGDFLCQVDQLSSSSSSSIGMNSDESSLSDSGGGDGGGEEVQSEYKGGGVLDSLEALEEVLPIKRGMSNFYAGKSKSFTSLSEASSCSSIKEIVKPENALTRKRKNLLAHNIFLIKNNHNCLRPSTGGISKRTTNSRSSVALAAMAHSDSNSNSGSSNSNSSSPVLTLPPLPPKSRTLSNKEFFASLQPQQFSPWRSFSLSDLQGVDVASSSIIGVFDTNDEKSDKLD